MVMGADELQDSDMNSRKRIPWMEGARSFNHCKGVNVGSIEFSSLEVIVFQCCGG